MEYIELVGENSRTWMSVYDMVEFARKGKVIKVLYRGSSDFVSHEFVDDEDAQKVYELLDVHFDSYAGESFYIDKMEPVIQELRDKIEGSLHGASASAEGTETESVESTDASQNALFVADLPESEYCWNLAQAARMALVPCLGRTLRPEVQTLVLRTLEAAVRLRRLLMPGLIRCCNYTLAFQPCLGDIHVGHVFFMPHSVSGFIDFETLHADNVATDVARLLGSMAGSDPLAWVLGLSAYQCVRRLREEELETVNLLRKSHLVVTALRWLNCVFSHGLPVHFSSGLVQRLAALCEGLESL